jgi:TetR/AcrR family transcriptional repressor of nem operon
MAVKESGNTAERILDTAERLVQERGFNAFSYADIANAVGVRKASLHYHFATKAALGRALIARYRRAFNGACDAIEASSTSPIESLERYVELYARVLRRRRMCLCGMLATDSATLPEAMRREVAGFFADNERWLSRVLQDGRRTGTVEFHGAPASVAALLVSTLEGAMLVARGAGGTRYFTQVTDRLLDGLRAAPVRRPTRRHV